MGESSSWRPSAQPLPSLCSQASAGNPEALSELLIRHHTRLLSHVRRRIGVDWQGKIDAEDILQEAYIGIFKSIGSFEFRDEDSFYHWAVHLVNHSFIDKVRSFRRQKRAAGRCVCSGDNSSHQALLDRCIAEGPTPSAILRRDEAIGALLSCIARLPDDYQTVVRRMYLDGQSPDTIARELGKSPDAVRRLAARALRRLARWMGRATAYLTRRDLL